MSRLRVSILCVVTILMTMPFQLFAASLTDIQPIVRQAPVPFPLSGKTVLAYEVAFNDPRPLGLELVACTVTNQDGKTVASYDGSTLNEMVKLPDDRKVTERAKQFSGILLRPVIFLWLSFSSDEPVPTALGHQLVFADKDGTQATISVPNIELSASAPAALPSPLTGPNWVATAAFANDTYHRRSLILIDGKNYLAQRFAVDFVQYDNKGRLFTGNRSKNESYPYYGAPVLSVAKATVCHIYDGVPDNTPGEFPPHDALTRDSVPGNHVILDLGEGRYALYGHLIPGSITVKTGQAVDVGDVLARLGNSGNSDAPHLHFHLCDACDALACEGLPFALNRYTAVGTAVPDIYEQGFGMTSHTPMPAVLTAMPNLTVMDMK
ncbi:M23 family metallopeptidase [Desulfovibrio inopinatus]|uniref:M23 family metallopeptidase n=1 Tax=Desulfovibrio inopinatus TaxID=102109 RepID=UPI00041F9092|nr:M23 family metallopeptidase [Desulfovibrio inopinatus]